VPLVSVVCPTYNRGAAIRSTIASVSSQSVTEWELIVVSDG
jgi:glycosyltransferase involved in cell wall biosynthesis